MKNRSIVSIVPYKILPYHTGGQKSIAQFNEFLGSISRLTTIGTRANNTSMAKNYRLIGWMPDGPLKYVSIRLLFKAIELVRANRADAFMIEHPYLGWLGHWVKKMTGAVYIVHTHNVEYQRFQSTGKKWWPLLRIYEKWALRSADLVFCISEEDRKCLCDEFGLSEQDTQVVTFGIPIGETPRERGRNRETIRNKHGIGNNEALLLFNGALGYVANLEALDAILLEINPRLMASGFAYKIIICGKGLPESYRGLAAFQDKNIIFAGMVDEIEPYFMAADVFLNPISSGGGIKTKLVEAIGFGATAVSTVTGAMGCPQEICGDKIRITKDGDWQAFAETTINTLGKTTEVPAAFYDYFYWGNITQKALDAIEKKLGVSHPKIT